MIADRNRNSLTDKLLINYETENQLLTHLFYPRLSVQTPSITLSVCMCVSVRPSVLSLPEVTSPVASGLRLFLPDTVYSVNRILCELCDYCSNENAVSCVTADFVSRKHTPKKQNNSKQ